MKPLFNSPKYCGKLKDRHKICFLVITVCFFFYFVTCYHYSGEKSLLYGDPSTLALTVESLYIDHDTDLKNQLKGREEIASDQIALGKNGQWYPLHEPLLVVLTLPLYAICGKFSFIIVNWLMLIGICWVLYSLASDIFSPLASGVAVLLTLTSRPFIEYSYSYSVDVLGTLLVCWCFALVYKKKYFLAGIVGGLLLFGRLPFAICNVSNCAILMLLALSIAFDKKPSFNHKAVTALLQYLFGFGMMLLLFGLENKVMFGSFFTLSYLHWVAVSSNGTSELMQRFSGMSLDMLQECIFSPSDGLIVGAPLVLLSIVVGVPTLWRTKRSIAINYILLTTIFLGFFSQFHGFPSFPNRYFLPVFALSVMPLTAFVFSKLPCAKNTK